MTVMAQVLINQSNILQTKLTSCPTAPLSSGQVRCALQRFALTANNVTYAATGSVLGYWAFFPSQQKEQGILPVWGFAEVIESRAADVPVGTRYYGFFPMADQVVMTPKVGAQGGITDVSAHRAELPIIYNQYVQTRTTNPQADSLRALLQPLLATSYLLADWLTENQFFNANQVVIGSASSKTGLGLAKFLAAQPEKSVQIVGLTSAANSGFVEGLGIYDHVLTYDAVEQLAQVPSVYVDMAGHAGVKQRLHTHLADVLRHSCAVGTSHWDKFQPKQDLAGPKPQFFFAPDQMVKRRKDWGPDVIERQIRDAWKGIAAQAETWLDVKTHDGLEAALPVYDSLARGQANPRDGHVIVL
ncbi:MAG: DUF2855 family protein [Paracoccaceae bacterium]